MDNVTKIVNRILKAEINKRNGKFRPGEYLTLLKKLDGTFKLGLFSNIGKKKCSGGYKVSFMSQTYPHLQRLHTKANMEKNAGSM